MYQAKIFSMEGNFEDKVYIGISALYRKQRLYNHRLYFPNTLLKNQTALSIIGVWSTMN